MIRTGIVNLTVIPAIAYRQKLPAGGSGIVILRGDTAQPGIASISKSSGDAIPTVNTSLKSFPMEAFAEAIKLTFGMPYRKLGGVKFVDNKPADAEEDAAEALPEEVIVDGKEYLAVVEAYTDKNGKLSYDLINKDMIKFAHSSSKARTMIAERETEEVIRQYVVGMKLRNITGNRDLTDAQVQKMVEMLDEVSPKGVFKEFNDALRLQLKAAKKK